MNRKRALNPDSASAQRLAQRRAHIETYKANALNQSDMSRAARSQLRAEISGIEAEIEMEIDEYLITEELWDAEDRVEAAGLWAQDSVTATKYNG